MQALWRAPSGMLPIAICALAAWLGAGPTFAQDPRAIARAVGAIPALKGIAVSGVDALAGSRNAYRAKLGSKDTGVTLVGTPGGGGNLQWSASLVTAELELGKHLPGALRALGEVAIVQAVIAVAAADHDLQVASLPPELRKSLQSLPGFAKLAKVPLKAGVNLLAAIRVSSSGTLGELAKHIGVADAPAALRGTVGAALLQSLANGQLPRGADALASIDLSVALGAASPPALSRILSAKDLVVTFKRDAKGVSASGSATFLVTLPNGKPVPVGTTLTLDPAPVNRESYFHFAGDLPPAAYARLPHAAMLKLKSLSLDVALMRDGARRVPFFGLTGAGQVGRGEVRLVGTLGLDKAGKSEVTLWADGEVTLADLLPGLSAPGLDRVALTHVSLGHGEIAGRARVGRLDIAVLAYLPAGKRTHNIVVGAGGVGMHDFVPAVRGTPLDALALSSGAFFLVPKENAARLTNVASLPDVAVDLLGGPQAVSAARPLDLRPGLNLFATLDVTRSKDIRSLLESMGFSGGTLPMHGTLDPEMFTHTPWKSGGGKSGASLKTFLSHLDLEVPLPPLRPPGVGEVLSLKTGTLAIRGQSAGVAVGIVGSLELKLGAPPMVVDGEFHSDPAPGRGGLLRFTAKEKTKLEHALGIPWLTLDEVQFDATFDRARRKVDLDMQAKAVLGGRRFAVKTSFVEAGGRIEDVVFAVTGRVPLSVVPGLGAMPALKGVELVNPEFASTHVSGEIDLLKTRFKVALLEHAGHWDLLFEHSAFKLAELLPKLSRTALGHVTFPKAVMVLSQAGFSRPVSEFPAVIRPALLALGIGNDGQVHADPGLSVVAAIDPDKATGVFARALHKLGVHRPVVVSGGIGGVLGGVPSLNLQATLPEAPKFPAKALRPRPHSTGGTLRLMLVGEEVTFGVGAGMGFRVGRDELVFDASVNASISADNVVLDVKGELEGAWHNPAGIKGLTLEDVSITLGVNETGAIVVSLGGSTRIGANHVILAAGASLLPEALGAPEAIAFLGQVKQLRFGDFVAMGTTFANAAGRTLPPGDLPHHSVELHDVTAAMMTPGAYLDPKLVKAAKLEITGIGMALAGTLVLDGRRLGSVRGSAGDQGVKLFGELAPFQVGGVAIDKAKLDAALALGALPHFTLATRARPFGTAVDLDVGLDSKGLHFVLEDKAGGHYTASIGARTTKGFSLSRDNDFALHAELGPDFIAHFRGLVKGEVEALFHEEDKLLAGLQRRLEGAQRDVATAQAKHDAATRGVQRAAVHTVGDAQARVADAQRRVQALRTDIAAKYAAAKQARQHLKLAAAAVLAADAERLQIELGGANATLRVAQEILAAMRKGAALPAAADPRVLATAVALEVARAAVEVGDAAVRTSRAVTADLRRAVERISQTDVLDIRRALIDGSIAKGASLTLNARVFGRRDVAVHAGYKPGDARAILASLGSAAGQLATHLRTHSHDAHAPAPPEPGPAPAPPPPPAPKVQMVSFDAGRYEVPASLCGDHCPAPPGTCMAVLGKDWEPQKRPGNAGPCPQPPPDGCVQAVIGPAEEITRYKGCPGYKAYDSESVPAGEAEAFAACAATGRVMASCPRPILIGAGWSKLPATGGTARIMCQLKGCGWTVDVHADKPGTATLSDRTFVFAEQGSANTKLEIAESTCVSHCPANDPAIDCSVDWSNQAPPTHDGKRLDHAGEPLPPCPAPPAEGGHACAQVVLGRLTDVARYKGCEGYVVLNRSDWTMEMNDAFIACTVQGKIRPRVHATGARREAPLAMCRQPIRIASGWLGATGHGIGPNNITGRELCQLRSCKWQVDVRSHEEGGARPAGN